MTRYIPGRSSLVVHSACDDGGALKEETVRPRRSQSVRLTGCPPAFVTVRWSWNGEGANDKPEASCDCFTSAVLMISTCHILSSAVPRQGYTAPPLPVTMPRSVSATSASAPLCPRIWNRAEPMSKSPAANVQEEFLAMISTAPALGLTLTVESPAGGV